VALGLRIGRALARLAVACHRRPVAVLLAAAVVSGLLSLAAARLQVESDLVALLPARFPSVQGLERYKARGGSVGYVVVVASGGSQADLLAFAEDVAPRLSALESVDYVEYRRPAAFFEDRLLYYLEPDALARLAEQVEDRADYERRKANPLLVDLEDAGPPALALDVADARLPAGVKRAPGSPYYLDEAGRTLLIMVKPTRLASDLPFARQVVADVQAELQSVPHPGVEVALGGRFAKRVAQQAMLQRDLGLTSLAAALLILLYLALHFRRASGVLSALAPLLVGLVATFAAAWALFGTLNVLTAFVGAILLGVGIDHGLHLLERYAVAWDAGASGEAAVRAAFEHTGRAVILAALTTALGFLGLAVSEFRAFREFGIIAALGSTLVVVAYAVVLPPLLRLLPTPRPPARAGGPFVGLARAVAEARVGVLVTSSIAAALIIAQLPHLAFEYDFAALDGRGVAAYALDARIDAVLGRQQASVAVLTADEVDAQAAALTLRARRAQGASTIDFVLTARDLVPEGQGDKRALIQRIQAEVAGLDPETLPAREQDALRHLQRMAAAPPFGPADLPRSIRRELALDGGGGLVLVFPAVRMSDGQAILRLAEELTDLPLPSGGTVAGAGEVMVLADVLRMVFRETPRVLGLTVAVVFLCLWLFLGDLRRATLAYAPAVVTVAATLGAAPLVGLELNYLNVVFIPVLFGMAVDSGVHLVSRAGEASQVALAETGRAIFGAALTTAAGFGALALAHHPGLRSLAALALLGVAVSLAVSLVWLAALILVFEGPPPPAPDVRESGQVPAEVP
jgi:predicted RND superfamily exporter protein